MNSRDFHALYPWARNDGTSPFTELFFTVDLPLSRAEIWPFLIDSSRFNRALGLGRRFEREENGQLVVQERLRGIPLEWIEHPWTWLFESHVIAEREFRRGPFRHFRAVTHVLDNPQGGVTVCVQFSWVLKSRLLGWLLGLALVRVRRDINKLFHQVAEAVKRKRAETEDNPYLVCTPITNPAITRRLDEIAGLLYAENLDRAVVKSLVNYVKCGDELDLSRIRPLKQARAWNLDEQELLRACVLATKAGLLNMSWDITCPHCRGVREETGTLSGIPKQGHCDVCDIDFSTSSENAVEISFHVHDSIRKSEKISFCAAEPAKKAHIKWQRPLSAGKTASAILQLPPGSYRLRDIVSKTKCLVEIVPGGAQELSWNVASDAAGTAKVAPGFGITVRNAGARAANFVLEELWWERDNLRPGRLFCVPEFQRLFSRDALGAGVQLDLGNQTIFFSDVVGSTKFYQEVGDSAAFTAIVAHFEELTEILVRNGGTIIKTIGDAVMAAFHTPEHCLKACEEAQLAFSGPKTRQKVRLRISAHYGPVIAVNWNTGKDYFGNVVNFAAKMQACAGAGEVALSAELMAQANQALPLKAYPSQLKELEISGRSAAARVTVFNLNPASAILRRVA